MHAIEKTPWLAEYRSSEGFIVFTVVIAIFTDAFIYGMIVPIIPLALVERVGARAEDAQSLVSILLAVYGASLLIGSPLFGYFADQCRLRRGPFAIGLIALALSTILFIFARSFAILVIARSLQGLSASAVWVVGLALIADNVPAERVGEAMGHTTIGLTWGFLFGPMVGGLLYEKLGFYGAFTVPVILTVVDIILRFAMIETPRSLKNDKSGTQTPSAASADGYSTFASGSQGSHQGNGHTEREIDSDTAPLLRSIGCDENNRAADVKKATVFALLRNRRLPLALFASLIMALIFSALETTLPIFSMETFHWSSTGAGLIFIATSVPSLAGVQIGQLCDRLGVRLVGAIAYSIAGCAWILMRLVSEPTIQHVVLLVSLLLLLGVVIVAIEIVSMTEVTATIDEFEAQHPGAFGDKSPVAQSYALFNMAFAGGQLLGPLVAGGLSVRAGWPLMTMVIGAICVLTAIPLGLFAGPRQITANEESEEHA